MALAAATAITGVAIVLLAIYGGDIVAGKISGSGEGFIPLDHMTRGIGLGGPGLVLPIIAFFISRQEPSRGLGGMIVVAGAMVLAGGAVVIVTADPAAAAEQGRMAVGPAPILVGGLIQLVLGALKIRSS